MKNTNLKHQSAALLALLVLLAAPSAWPAITVTFLAPGQWGLPDEDLGLGGGVVEDFEDVILAPGLLYEIADASGSFTGTGSSSLPGLFDPVNGDPFGDAFILGVWDGNSVLVNTVTNQSQYYGAQDWRQVAFHVPEGTAWIALASCQVTGNHTLRVNGQAVGRLVGLGMELGIGRNGVMVVSSDDPADPVVSVSFGGAGDAFVIDHVVFAEPGTVDADGSAWGRLKALYR